MKTETSIARTTFPNIVAGRFRIACAVRLLPLLLFLLLPAAAQALTYLDYTYTINGGEITITRYNGPGGAVTIPPTIPTIGGLPVTSIGYQAFSGCTSLTSVTIPDSVTSIGKFAFYNCTSLNSVTIGNSVTNIGDFAFEGCNALKSVTIPYSVTSIGQEAFYSCTSLISVTIGNGLTSIKDRTFSYCTGLKSVTIGNSVTSIGYQAFSGCTSLTSVTIPDSVTSIGQFAFYNCTSLNSVTIGNSVTNIGDFAFEGCTFLKSVTIPDSVTSIGQEAFYGCTSLTSVIIGSSVTSIGNYAFYGCTKLTGVYFQGNAPIVTNDVSVFSGDINATVYYLPGTTRWGSTFDGRPTALSPLSTITTTTGAPPNTLSSTLKPIDTSTTPPSGKLKRWNGSSWQSVTSWNDPNIHTNQPTVVIAHGWKTADGGGDFFVSDSKVSGIAKALYLQSSSANILAWDWQDQAVSHPGEPLLFLSVFEDVKQEGLNGAAASARSGSIQGVRLAHELQGLHISNDKLQLIGHSNGGAVAGAAASELARGGQKVKRITTLDTPNLSLGELPVAVVWPPPLGIDPKLLSTSVNAMKYIKADSASQVEVYYSGLEAGRHAFGFGEPLLASTGNNRFNGMIYPGNVVNPLDPSQLDHIRIIDWYWGKDRTHQLPGPGQFIAGIDWSILSTDAGSFKAGTFAEQSFNSGVFGQFTPTQQQPVTLKKLWWDGFETGADVIRNWFGQHADLFICGDVLNAVVRLTAGSDGYLYRDVSVPSDASYLTFDLKVETPDPDDFLTVTLGNEIIYYKALNTADSDFYTVDPIFVGNFAGQTETLLFTLNHVGNGTPSILLDNITLDANAPSKAKTAAQGWWGYR